MLLAADGVRKGSAFRHRPVRSILLWPGVKEQPSRTETRERSEKMDGITMQTMADLFSEALVNLKSTLSLSLLVRRMWEAQRASSYQNQAV
jgi:hypothetical protein